jgi:hypothetical protein
LLAGVTIGNAVHYMQIGPLFHRLSSMIRPGGGIAVIANGTPVWLQDSDWALALRTHLEHWFGPLAGTCGTAPEDRRAHLAALQSAGFTDISNPVIAYDDVFDLDHLVGHLYSAISGSSLGDSRAVFEEGLRARMLEVEPSGQFVEHVRVDLLIGRLPPPRHI